MIPQNKVFGGNVLSMKRCKLFFCVVFVMLFMSACGQQKKSESQDVTTEKEENTTNTDTTIQSTVSESPVADSYMPATLEYFKNVDKNYKFKDIEKEIGPNSRYEGSGVCYYVWVLEDNLEAWVYFSANDNKICRIHIYGDSAGTYVLYDRYDDTTE